MNRRQKLLRRRLPLQTPPPALTSGCSCPPSSGAVTSCHCTDPVLISPPPPAPLCGPGMTPVLIDGRWVCATITPPIKVPSSSTVKGNLGAVHPLGAGGNPAEPMCSPGFSPVLGADGWTCVPVTPVHQPPLPAGSVHGSGSACVRVGADVQNLPLKQRLGTWDAVTQRCVPRGTAVTPIPTPAPRPTPAPADEPWTLFGFSATQVAIGAAGLALGFMALSGSGSSSSSKSGRFLA
jgi:hypothetical protein